MGDVPQDDKPLPPPPIASPITKGKMQNSPMPMSTLGMSNSDVGSGNSSTTSTPGGTKKKRGARNKYVDVMNEF